MRLSTGIALLFVATACAGTANAQSFNCRRAYFADEKMICARPELAQLDNQLAAVFGRAIGRLSPSERAALENRETRWVIGRRKCGSDVACIAQHYRSRIEQLSQLAGRGRPEEAPPSAAAAAAPAPPASEKQPAPRKARTTVRT
ncbi:MAG: lysozyme inhibitor LprI family protein, partial [Thiohalocapsa sp.]